MKKTIPLGSRKAGALVLVLALGLASVSLAAEHTWRQKADMPTPRFGLSTSVVDGKIYAIGGATSEPNPVPVWPVEVYDPIMDSWTQKADMLTGRAMLSTSVVDGKIYAIGGRLAHGGTGVSTVVEEYDPATDTWTGKTDMPTPRWGLSTSVVNGKIYAIGGRPKMDTAPLSTVEEYDPTTDTWTQKVDMPTPKYGLSTSVVNGKIYAIGGAPQSRGERIVEAYDPATDTWTRKADMPTARRNFSTSAVCGKIYAIGGWDTSIHYPYPTVEQYDPVTDTWTKEADMPDVRANLSTSVVNSKIYAIGGTFRPHPCPATSTVYELTISAPSPDFNGDGIVNSADICIMVDHWGTDEPLCDIAPPPCGDGIVDFHDIAALAEYWLTYPGAVAYWKLDETEGFIAHDSVGDCNGTLIGGPVWQPTGGMVAGALQFDGIDDYVSTTFVLNPGDKVFSIFAWIKGGAPGQAVISQTGSVNWLSADASAGNLMTELRHSAGRVVGPPLWSQTVITDGDWHRVGFVWDGTSRILYVDDIEVARDTQTSLGSSEGGLCIGASSTLDAASFFSGLIDDVRIYNRAVTP